MLAQPRSIGEPAASVNVERARRQRSDAVQLPAQLDTSTIRRKPKCSVLRARSALDAPAEQLERSAAALPTLRSSIFPAAASGCKG